MGSTNIPGGPENQPVNPDPIPDLEDLEPDPGTGNCAGLVGNLATLKTQSIVSEISLPVYKTIAPARWVLSLGSNGGNHTLGGRFYLWRFSRAAGQTDINKVKCVELEMDFWEPPQYSTDAEFYANAWQYAKLFMVNWYAQDFYNLGFYDSWADAELDANDYVNQRGQWASPVQTPGDNMGVGMAVIAGLIIFGISTMS